MMRCGSSRGDKSRMEWRTRVDIWTRSNPLRTANLGVQMIAIECPKCNYRAKWQPGPGDRSGEMSYPFAPDSKCDNPPGKDAHGSAMYRQQNCPFLEEAKKQTFRRYLAGR